METDDFDPRLPAFRAAVYTPDSNLALAGNPMAEVWPGPQTDAYASLASRYPRRESEFFDKPLAVRIEDLERLDGFHYPFTGEEYSMRKVITLSRTSFIPRSPAKPQFMKALMAAANGDLKLVPRMSETGGGGKLGFLIIGPTGCGKSSFADRIMRLFGSQPWLHTDLNGRRCQWFQLGAIRVKAKRSLRATLELAVQCIDAQLRTDFYSQKSQTGSSTRYENALTAGLTVHAAPFLLIDDIERLLGLPGTEAEGILNTLVDIMEFAGIPVILVGTIRAYRMFERFPTIMQKFSSGGVARFGPVPQDRDFENFARAMLKRNVSPEPLNEADDFIEQLWLYTFGVRRVTREAVRCVLTRHAYEPGLKLNGALLASIFDEDLPEYKESLQLMRQVALGVDPGFKDHQRYEDYVPQQAPKVTTEAADVIRQFRVAHNISPSGITEHITPEVFADLRAQQVAANFLASASRLQSTAQGHSSEQSESQAAGSPPDPQAQPGLTHPDDVTKAQLQAMMASAGPASAPDNAPSPQPSAAPDTAAGANEARRTEGRTSSSPAKEKRASKKDPNSNVVDFTNIRKKRSGPVDPSELR